MYTLSNIGPKQGAKHRKKRRGFGAASGLGKTAGKGTKGQKARGGGGVRPGFEGGQMPLYRRLPKRGFKNPFRKRYTPINLRDLPENLAAGTVVDAEYLRKHGILPKVVGEGIKLLGHGDIGVAVTVRVQRISATAKSKIEAAGGTVELI